MQLILVLSATSTSLRPSHSQSTSIALLLSDSPALFLSTKLDKTAVRITFKRASVQPCASLGTQADVVHDSVMVTVRLHFSSFPATEPTKPVTKLLQSKCQTSPMKTSQLRSDRMHMPDMEIRDMWSPVDSSSLHNTFLGFGAFGTRALHTQHVI